MPEIVTTCRQMSALSELEPARLSDPDVSVREAVERRWRLNRALYRLAGERGAWIDKRRWSDQRRESDVLSEQLRTFVASRRGSTAGCYELRRDDAQAVEIACFGLAPHFIGRGFGGALLADAPQRAWAWDAHRVWVHPCSLDHAAALKNAEARGMQAYDRKTHHVA